MSRVSALVVVISGVLSAAAPAAAQGNGHGHAYGHGNTGGAGAGPSAAGAPELQLAGTGIRNFGSWLDDASVLPAGQGIVSISFGYWKTPGYREFDVPAVDGGVGVARRVQVGFSVPFYHASQPGGPVARGLGDLYLSGKIQLRDPSAGTRRVGFAVTPILEVLSHAPKPDAGRASWALPVSMELQRTGWRAFGSVGYFSRGSLFASGAVEVAVSERVWATGSISQSHSIQPDDLSRALGLSQTRTDISGGLTVAVSPRLSLFGMTGRTISKQDPNSSTLFITSGVSVNFDAAVR